MYFGIQELCQHGFKPKKILDIGAYEGNWSRMANSVWPLAEIRMIEPNRAKLPILNSFAEQIGASVSCELLGAEDGKMVEFHLMQSGSSIMAERSSVPRETELREMDTLDSLFPDVESVDLIKIDAQGYELEILKGANRLIQGVAAILLEVAIIEINEGAPILHEVLDFMKDRGFVTYDILEIHRRPLDKALNQIDIMFVREESHLIADKRHF